MKKQIFILVILVVAVFASVNESFGQATHYSKPVALTCANDALHPLAGKEYTYDILGTLGAGNYTYWATKDPNFYAADSTYTVNLGARLNVAAADLTKATDYGAPSTTATTKITWTTDLLAKTKFQSAPNVAATTASPSPTFVAVHYKPTVGCADNFKVFELNPINGFTVDIRNLGATKDTLATRTLVNEQCFANVTSAKYNATSFTMDYLYGYNTLYYEVIAANFSASWTPSFKITGLNTKQDATIEWSYTRAFASPVVVVKNVADGSYASPSAALTDATDTSNGVSIFVRVTVKNNSFEGLAQQTLAFAVDGKNSANQLDVLNTDCSPVATPDYADSIEQKLNERPTITEGTNTTSTITPIIKIIPKNP
jgi:hypothetical protein